MIKSKNLIKICYTVENLTSPISFSYISGIIIDVIKYMNMLWYLYGLSNNDNIFLNTQYAGDNGRPELRIIVILYPNNFSIMLIIFMFMN